MGTAILTIAVIVMWATCAVTVSLLLKARRQIEDGFTAEHHNQLHANIVELHNVAAMMTILVAKLKENGAKLFCTGCGVEVDFGPGMEQAIGVGEREDGSTEVHCPSCVPTSVPDTVPDDWE